MAEEKVSCVDCGVQFLKTTADCTDGKCMPCFSGNSRENQIGLSSGINEGSPGNKMTVGEKVGAVALLGSGFCLMVVLFPVIGIVVGLIARYGFNASWNTTWMIGGFTYIGLNLLSSLSDAFAGNEVSNSDKGRKELSRKWAEKHGTKSEDDSS